jgi:hypothetical protein
MHYFEEEYQRRFKEGQSTEGVDQDQLWANIDSALPPEEKRRGSSWRWALGLLFLLLGLSIGGYYFSLSDENNTESRIDGIANTSPAIRNETTNTTNTTSSTAFSTTTQQANLEPPLNTASNPAEITTHKKGNDLQVSLPLREEITAATNSPQVSSKETRNEEPLVTEHISIPESSTTKPTKEALPAPSSTVADNNVLVKATSSVVAKLIRPINTLALPLQTVALPAIVLPSPVVGSTKALPLSLGFFTGISFWEERSQGDNTPFAQQLDGLLKSEAGLSTALEVRRPISSSIDLISGFHYTYSRTVFEYSRSWDTVMYRNNIPGADLINAKGFREVKHHNSLQTLTIPLLAGWSSHGKKLQVGINTGVGLNLVLEQAGRSLNAAGEVFTFNGNNAPYPDVYLSYHIQPQLSYPLGQQFRLHFRPGISYQSLGTPEVYNLKRSAWRTDWSVGVSWRK